MSVNHYTTFCDADGKHYVCGPGNGFNYYGGTLFPFTRFETEALAAQAALCADEAYRAGYEAAKNEVRRALRIA